MKIGEIAVGTLFLTGAAVAFVIAGSFRSTANPVDPGPSLYPQIMAVLMGLCALGVIGSALRKPRAKSAEGGRWPLALLTLAIAVVYLLVFKSIGYMVSTGVLLVVMMLLGGVRNWVQLAAITVVYVGATYYLFNSVLMLKLP